MFINLDGKSCYANSVLQAMSMLQRLGAAIKHEVGAVVPRAWSHLCRLLNDICWDDHHLSHVFLTAIAVRREVAKLTGKQQYAQAVEQDTGYMQGQFFSVSYVLIKSLS